MIHSKHPVPGWQRWLGLSEVWVGVELSSRLLVLLRWLAAIGQSATLLMVAWLGVSVPWGPCVIAVGITLVSNAVLVWWTRALLGHLIGGFFQVLLWDALTLTFLLHWTGGLENPFALFYLVQLTVAAVALRSSAVIGLGALMAMGCGWLWLHAKPLRMIDTSTVPEGLLQKGRGVAIVLVGTFILALLLSLRRRSHRLQKERERLRAELESRDRFLSIAALATGFAHELATPLGTIALAAEEMKALPTQDVAETIAREATRCQDVLVRLRELGQEAIGQSAEQSPVTAIVEVALNDLPSYQRERLKLIQEANETCIACAGLREALLVLLRNALLSSADHLPVALRVQAAGGSVRFIVQDQGPGFSEEMLRHWGEPFRSTRDQGVGMGLGLFFVRRLAAAQHSSIEVCNLAAGGARVTLILPLQPPSHA
jgi:two-component system sensor histidine kinase RegB